VATSDRGTRPRARAVVGVVLVVLGGVAAPLAVTSSWARGLVTDTDAYVAVVAPLADDPDVQAAVSRKVGDAVVAGLDSSTRIEAGIAALGDSLDLPPAAASALSLLAAPAGATLDAAAQRATDRAVRSHAFTTVWTAANRAAHGQAVAALEGREGRALALGDEGVVTLDLGALAAQVSERFGSGRLDGSRVDATMVLAQSEDLAAARDWYRALDAVGTLLPWACVVLVAAGVLLAPRRLRAAGTAAVAAAVLSLVLVGAGRLVLGRYAAGLDPGDAAAVGAVARAVLGPLQQSLGQLAVLTLLIAALALIVVPYVATRRAAAAIHPGTGGGPSEAGINSKRQS
jgi:hypothetical protein